MVFTNYNLIQDNGIDEYFTDKFDGFTNENDILNKFNGPLYENRGLKNKTDLLKYIINDNLFTQEINKTQCAENCIKNNECKQFMSVSNENGSVCGLLKTEICNNNDCDCDLITEQDRNGMTFTYYTKK